MKCNLKRILLEENINKEKFLEELERSRINSFRRRKFLKSHIARILNNGQLSLEDALIISKSLNKTVDEIWYIEEFDFKKAPTKR
ncbi:hypothetical protein J5Y03_09995 [Bacillus sp. RG28]|uniref:Uncharacterized protein n=1 Tax=Gottfriedia endophytica TaxID=2820819 RepID=A0A940NV83_9BACI|nr:hypothetical protein [Gottfriedia endophytica]MBP0725518.1 hypothetical protein [Gottfriedia endophytica]